MASDEPVLCLINAVLGQVDAVLFGNPAWVLAWLGAGFDFHLSGHPLARTLLCAQSLNTATQLRY